MPHAHKNLIAADAEPELQVARADGETDRRFLKPIEIELHPLSRKANRVESHTSTGAQWARIAASIAAVAAISWTVAQLIGWVATIVSAALLVSAIVAWGRWVLDNTVEL